MADHNDDNDKKKSYHDLRRYSITSSFELPSSDTPPCLYHYVLQPDWWRHAPPWSYRATPYSIILGGFDPHVSRFCKRLQSYRLRRQKYTQHLFAFSRIPVIGKEVKNVPGMFLLKNYEYQAFVCNGTVFRLALSVALFDIFCVQIPCVERLEGECDAMLEQRIEEMCGVSALAEAFHLWTGKSITENVSPRYSNLPELPLRLVPETPTWLWVRNAIYYAAILSDKPMFLFLRPKWLAMLRWRTEAKDSGSGPTPLFLQNPGVPINKDPWLALIPATSRQKRSRATTWSG